MEANVEMSSLSGGATSGNRILQVVRVNSEGVSTTGDTLTPHLTLCCFPPDKYLIQGRMYDVVYSVVC